MSERNGKKWTADEDDKLKRLHASGMRHAMIARKIGRTVEAISCRAAVLGLTTIDRIRLWTAEDDDTLRRMRAQGATSAQIGVALQRNRGGIDKRLKLLGLTNRRPGRAADPVAAPALKQWAPPDERLELVVLWREANARVRERQAEPYP